MLSTKNHGDNNTLFHYRFESLQVLQKAFETTLVYLIILFVGIDGLIK